MADIGRSWLELARIGWNRLILAAVGLNWLELAEIDCDLLKLVGCDWILLQVELAAQQAEDADLALLTDLNEGSVAKPKKVLHGADKPAKQKSKVLDHKPR